MQSFPTPPSHIATVHETVRRHYAAAAVCFLVVVGSGCGAERGSAFEALEKDPSFPGSPSDANMYAGLFRFSPIPSCAVSNPMDLGVRTELRVFSGASVTDADVHEFLGALQRYYSQYVVTMFTRYDIIRLSLDRALIFDTAALSAEVEEETGVDLNGVGELSQAQIDRAAAALGRAVLHNVRELIRVYGEPRRTAINVVLLDEMVSRPLPCEFAQFQSIAGLGLSPQLIARAGADDPERTLYDWLDVSAEFTPIAIVGVSPVKSVLREPDIAIAHEVAHAYGLVHATDPNNLLSPSSAQCSLELDPTQLATVQATAEALTAANVVDTLSRGARSREFVRTVRDVVLARAHR